MGLLNKSLYKKKHNKQYLRIVIAWVALVGTVPLWALDTDNDTLPDIFESNNGRDPLVPDYLVSAGWNTTCGKDDSTTNGQGVQCWGANSTNLNNNMPAFTKLTQITNGSAHACAIDDGAAVCWGSNFDGRATPPVMTNVTHISAFKNHSCAAHDAGVSCWGKETDGQTVAPVLNNPLMVGAGDRHSCALDENGGVNSVVCWGSDAYGQSTPPALSNPVFLASGEHTNCVIDDTGVVCWGENGNGQATPPALSNPLVVAVGAYHACAIDDTGVVCWGTNADGQLNLPTITSAVDINLGWKHSCALSQEGIQCWEYNANSQSDTSGLDFDSDNDGTQNISDGTPYGVEGDADSDGVGDFSDNCPDDANAGQEDVDGDGVGDACDDDSDNDTVPDVSDNCPLIPNLDQLNNDGDAEGDVCDTDDDNDTVLDGVDNCPWDSNVDQIDTDGDNDGDACDSDDDNDGMPDDWENTYGLNPLLDDTGDDLDGDGATNYQEYLNSFDPSVVDNDPDVDGINNLVDNCPGVANNDQLDTDGDNDGDACDTDDDDDGMPDSWELTYGLNTLVDDSFEDADADEGTNLQEYQDGNDPLVVEDGDGDGASYYQELDAGSSDSDADQRPYWLRTFYGRKNSAFIGSAIDGSGDINNDGYQDLVVGSYLGDIPTTTTGTALVLDGASGALLYRVVGDSGDRFGFSVSAAGDLNGDGYNDWVVGAPYDDDNGNNSGSVFALSGVDGSQLYITSGDSGSDQLGYSVGGIGDINGDGYGNFAAGAPIDNKNGTKAGEALAYRGYDGQLMYSTLGINGYDEYGFSVSGAGDVNNDGYSDYIVGAPYSGSGARILSGTGEVLYSIDGGPSSYFGHAVSGAGDINNDGYADFIVGAPVDDTIASNSGYAKVYSGVDGSELYAVYGDSQDDRMGYSVSGAGDVNNDGYDDFLVGGVLSDNSGVQAGAVWAYSGIDGSLLHEVHGKNNGDNFGYRVTGMGDIDADGYDDFAVGAPYADDKGNARGYVRIYTAALLENDIDRDFIVNSADLDNDNDGTPDASDAFPLDPTEDTDTDSDSVGDNADNCVGDANAGQEDFDNDGLGDVCDADADGDGLSNDDEINIYLTDPLDPNSDDDNFPDATDPFPNDPALPDISATELYRFATQNNVYQYGYQVAMAGDVTDDQYGDFVNDDYDDLLVAYDDYVEVRSGLDGSFVYELYGGPGASISEVGDIRVEGYGGFSGVEFDGFADVVVGTDSQLMIFSGMDGSWVAQQDNIGASATGVGDVNGDGYSDYAYIYQQAFYPNPAIVKVASGDGGTELLSLQIADGCWFVDRAGDVNNDGYADVLAVTNIGVQVYSGQTGGILHTLPSYSEEAARGVGDVNGDGYDDIAVINGYGDELAIYSGQDASLIWGYQAPVNYSMAEIAPAGDLNGDGYADLILGSPHDHDANENEVGTVRVFSGLDGLIFHIFEGEQLNEELGASVDGGGDVNNDGVPDLVISTYSDDIRVYTLFIDSDGDGVADPLDPFRLDPTESADTDSDGIGNNADTDDDNDGILDVNDAFPLDPTETSDNDSDGVGDNADTDDDNDGMPDTWEDAYGLNPLSSLDAGEDPDGDYASNLVEYQNGTDPLVVDNDGDADGANDYADNCLGLSNPDQLNTDGDSEGDACDADDDNDGMPDIWELANGLESLIVDSFLDLDADGWTNLQEYQNGSDPGLRVDVDGDSSLDYEEFLANTSDSDAAVRPYWWHTINGHGVSDQLGNSVSGAGDVNNDGYGDLIVGARYDDDNGSNSGSARVISGKDNSILYIFNGDDAGDNFGSSVSDAGDVNNDGYDDLIVGADRDQVNGVSSGSARVFSGINGAELYTFSGDGAYNYFGESVSDAGDVNNDGYDDLIVGASGNDNNGSYSGSARVFSGIDGSELYAFNGDDADDYFGESVSGAGDVNGDGYDDFIVGANGDDNNGSNSGSASVFSGLNGSVLYTFNGEDANNKFGIVVSDAGDVNNDGYGDLIVGAPYDSDVAPGSGSATLFSGMDGSILYSFNGTDQNDRLGFSLSGAGDVNGDGYADVIVVKFDSDNGGYTFVHIFSGISGEIIYTFINDDQYDNFGYSVSSAGDVDNDNYADLIIGAYRDDNNGSSSGSARVILSSDLMNDVDLDFIINSADPDDDNDTLPDAWENTYGLNPLDASDAALDGDGDGSTNIEEYSNGTDPTVFDAVVSVKDDYNNDGLAGWIWHGTGGSVDNLNRTWTPDWNASSPGWVPPTRTFPPPSDAIAGYDIVTTGDFNGDGDADWLWRESAGAGWKIWQMEGGYRSGQNTPADFDAAHDWAVAGAGDTDRDGDDDVILFNSTTGEINIWEMQTTHIATHNVGTRSGFDVVRVGDFDNDADTDLMLRKQNEDVLRFWEIEDNAFVQEHTTSQTGTNYVSQCAGDFNNDGHTDVYFLAPDGTSKWYEYSNFVRQQQIYGANQSAWTLLGCGDYDGDGDTDMLWTTADGEGRNKIFINESFNNSATFYTNRYGGTNPVSPGYGYEKRGNGN